MNNSYKENLYALKKHTKKEDFFKNKNNLQVCYWAGFIAADGSIDDSNRHSVCIGLSEKDFEHLNMFIDHVSWTGRVGVYSKNSAGYGPNLKRCQVSISSAKEWIEDLNDIFNITPRKTITLMPPCNLNYEQELAFIVGFLDGDGYLGVEKGRKVIEVNGASRIFIEWIAKKLSELTISKKSINIRQKSKGKPHIFKFSVSGKKVDEIIIKMKELDILKLERKWNKFYEN